MPSVKSANNGNSEIELRGGERAFQIDRDTIIIYTGLHREDVRPFLRIGAGDLTPGGLLRHIENVVIPDTDPLNVGLEMFWLHSTLQGGGDVIRYVGSKDRVSQIYNYSGMTDIPEEQRPPVEVLPYRALLPEERNSRDKCMINFLETGNVDIAVNGSKVLDLQSYKKGTINIDREYDLINKALNRRKKKCESGYGFIFIDSARTPGVSLYFNFNGKGLFVNPPRNYHYALFENVVRPDRLEMCIAASPYAPGFVEVLRRKHAVGGQLGLFNLNQEKIIQLKKFYSNARLKMFDDSRVLPFSKEAIFFLSRGTSHGAFAVKTSEESARHLQLVFPTGGGKYNQKFESIRGPHDLEIEEVHDIRQIRGLQPPDRAALTLHVAGNIKGAAYQKSSLQAGLYPLVGSREYTVHQADTPAALYERFLDAVSTSPCHEELRNLVLLSLGLDFDFDAVDRVLFELSRQQAPKDIIERNNVHEILRFIAALPLVAENFSEKQIKKLESIRRKFSLSKIRVGDWLGLRDADVEFQLVFWEKNKAYLLVQAIENEIVRFQFPPDLDVLENDIRSYRTLLKRQARAVDRAYNAPGYREGIQLMETILEERSRLIEERTRFRLLLQRLGMEMQSEEEDGLPAYLPAFLEKPYLFFRRIILEPIKSLF